MNNSKWHTVQIAYLNIKHSLTRTVGLIFITAALSFVLFGGGLFMISLQKGLQNMKERMGADIMIVPVENSADMEAILLKGEPSCFYFSNTLEGRVSTLEGVEKCSSQFFLTSLDADCCDARVQLIGFDPATDFSVQPWISRVYNKKLEDGAVIIGSDIQPGEEGEIKLFGKKYPIAAQLDATGTGLDQAVFGTIATIKDMYQMAYEKGQRFLEDADPDKSISTILIRVADDCDVKMLIKNIRKELGGVQVVEAQSMVRGTAENMERIASLLFLFGGLILIITIVSMSLVYALTSNERKKEMAILRTLGATRQKLIFILLSEAAMISGFGGLIGIITACIFILPFQIYIGDYLGMPFINPGIGVLLGFGLLTALLAILIGPLTVSVTAWKISKAEVYLTMREGD